LPKKIGNEQFFLKLGDFMKLLLLSLALSTSAFAQFYPTRPGPLPGPEQFCSRTQIQATTNNVIKECNAKMAEFSSLYAVDCDLTRITLKGCYAMCKLDKRAYARLRMDVRSNCRRSTANLKKTVIKYY
jgi:hypothetical protein